MNEFKQAYQVLYQDPGSIAQKKLLALAVGLNHSKPPKRTEARREEQVAKVAARWRVRAVQLAIEESRR